MNPKMDPAVKELIQVAHYGPAVSLIMPFEPKMGLKAELSHALKLAADKVEAELSNHYPGDIAGIVMEKLRVLIKGLNFNTHKKSIAIYVSPTFERILYLDIPVEEKIIVDNSFSIRDLVYSKKQQQKYLVLMLSAKESRMFVGSEVGFVRIVSNKPESAHAYVNDKPEPVANFSDMSSRREEMLDKFLAQVDSALNIILNAYHLPLFVLGTKRVIGHFKKLTNHGGSVIQYIHGNYEEATMPQLKKVLAPFVADWKKVLEKDVLNQLDNAANQKKLSIGIRDVWQDAMQHKGRLLVVEKNFLFVAHHSHQRKSIFPVHKSNDRFSYLKDTVDDIIERVLEDGGDVQFVDKDILKGYEHIALVKYFK